MKTSIGLLVFTLLFSTGSFAQGREKKHSAPLTFGVEASYDAVQKAFGIHAGVLPRRMRIYTTLGLQWCKCTDSTWSMQEKKFNTTKETNMNVNLNMGYTVSQNTFGSGIDVCPYMGLSYGKITSYNLGVRLIHEFNKPNIMLGGYCQSNKSDYATNLGAGIILSVYFRK